ncbi:MAG: hypothetical protein QOF63_3179 [Thermoanaerobaculia bacterium]|nr:hypothetical protein [Thermoanaerobaculia bacterium]
MADKKPTPEATNSSDLPDGKRFVAGIGGDDTDPVRVTVEEPVRVTVPDAVDVKLTGAAIGSTPDQALWVAIRSSARSLAFQPYKDYIDTVLCAPSKNNPLVPPPAARHTSEPPHVAFGIDAYQLLRAATEAYVLLHCGTAGVTIPTDYKQLDENSRFGGKAPNAKDIGDQLTNYLGNGVLPYIDHITSAFEKSPTYLPFCNETGIAAKVLSPLFLELLWSYWEEEGMLVQSMNALAMRFQNKRGPGERDPLANFATSPLRPLANFLWGYVEDDDHRLTIARREYEYQFEYGLPLARTGAKLRPAESRSKFLAAFHALLHAASVFYDRAANLTVRADGFPLLNALREVHLLLAEGAHNQYRDLPWTARMEMLMMQWILSRQEVREFLGARASVPYKEPWMPVVDSVKRLMAWSDTSVTYFHDLATDGEMILLSARFGDWSVINDDEQARAWAQYWRPEIQRYIHAYQTVTGIDLSAVSQDRQVGVQINATPPSVLLQERLSRQRAAKG